MPEFKALLDSPTVYRTQIYFSKITRDENGKVKFTDYHFKKHNLYYYPASCVKLPVIVSAMRFMNQYDSMFPNFDKINLDCKIEILDSNYCGFKNQITVQNKWTFADYMKRMLVVSDNICFNPVYDFVRPIAPNFYFKNTCIQQRFNASCNYDDNRKIPDMMISNDSQRIQVVHSYYPKLKPKFDSAWATAGKKYLDAKDSLINSPKNFYRSNFIELKTLHNLLKEYVVQPSPKISKEDFNFLQKYMSIFPSECRHPAYDPKEYPDNWGKYLLIGDDTNFHAPSPLERAGVRSDSIRIFNKVGMAYGFLTDCAYIVDYKNQVEFVVSASVFVDRDGTLNDGKYAYKEIGLPFLGKLGRVLMQHELKHKRKSKFAPPKIEYND